MIQSPLKRRAAPPQDKRLSKAKYVVLVAQFLAGWIVSMALIAMIALVHDINWFKPHIANMLADSLHRKVRLGKIKWQFGFNGLAISTDQLSIVEPDNLPLLTTQKSEIGIAFWPLLRGDIQLRYLKLKQPEFWAIYLGNGRWNFSDLLEAIVDVRLADISKGTLHIRDFSQPLVLIAPKKERLISPMDMENVELNFVWPKKNKHWPLYLSYELPRPHYRTKVKLTSWGKGEFKDWEVNPYRFSLKVEDLKPKDLSPIVRIKQIENALVDLSIEGEGVLQKGITVKTNFAGWGLKAANLKDDLPATKGQGTVLIDSNKISWKGFNLNVGELSILSNGELDNWRSQSSEQSVSESHLGPLAELLALKVLAFDRKKIDLNRTYDLALNGPASSKKVPEARIEFTVKVNPANKQVKEILASTPFADILDNANTNNLTGQIITAKEGRIEIPKARLSLNNGLITISGFLDRTKQATELKFSALRFPLDKLFNSIKKNAQIRAVAPPVNLSGLVDIEGEFKGTAKTKQIIGTAKLNNARVSLLDGTPLSELNGTIDFNNHELVFTKLHGTLAQGTLSINGRVPVSGNGPIKIALHASHTDLSKLVKALKTLNVPCPEDLLKAQLSGSIKELNANVTGTVQKPVISMTLIPDKVRIANAQTGLQNLQIIGGTIRLDGSKLAFDDLKVNTATSKIDLSLKTDDWQDPTRLNEISISTASFPLEELHSILTSLPAASFPARTYKEIITQTDLSQLKGNASGDILWSKKGHGTPGELDGHLSLNNVSLKIQKQSIEQFSGNISLGNDKISVERASGMIGHSRFVLTAHILDHQNQIHWQGILKSSVFADDLTNLLSLLPGSGKRKPFHIESNQNAKFVLNFNGNPKSCQVNIAGNLPHDAHLSISDDKVSWSKPTNQHMSVDADVTLTDDQLATAIIKNFEIQVGQSKLKATGKLVGDKLDAVVETDDDFDAASIAKTISFNDRSLSKLERALKDTKGHLKARVGITGTEDNLRIDGFIRFDDMDLPLLSLSRASGEIRSSGWELFVYDPKKLTNEEQQSKANLKITKAKLGRVDTEDIYAEITQEGTPVSGIGHPWVITITSLSSHLAKGAFSMSGKFEPFTGKVIVDAKFDKIDANKFFGQFAGQKDEISGLASGNVYLTSTFGNNKEFLKHLDGKGELTISNGKVARFGNLQARITQANLLAQGLLGFNLNNLLQSFVPVRTGEFNKFFGNFTINNGIVDFEELRFTGNDMRLWADGIIDLPGEQVKLSVAGNVPRVSSSMIGGPLGKISRSITIQRFLDTVTLHAFDGMPSLPLIGDIASDKPRAFAFKVSAPSNQPVTIAKSIEKSFGWLPSQPKASAHPIPNL